MERRRWRNRLGALPMVLSFAALGGCEHFDLFSKSQAVITASASSEPKLKGRQFADVQVAVGRSLEKQGETAQAIAAYSEALRIDPSRADACLRLAVLRDQEGKFQESLALYQKALAGTPGHPDIFCDMGYSLYLQRRLVEAEINLRQALALAPDHARAHNNLGFVLAALDRCEDALVEFRRAGCKEADAEINLAFALTLEKHWVEARHWYQKALAADASSTAARKGLQELDTVLARLDRVRRASTAGEAVAAVDRSPVPVPASGPTGNQQITPAASLQPATAANSESSPPRGGLPGGATERK